MEFEEYKKERIKALRESIRLFSNDGKKELEVWVVEQFLNVLNLTYTESDIVCLKQKDEPPDVTFRDARFEVMELYDRGRLRDKEYKERLRQLEAATSYSDILEREGWDLEAISLQEVITIAEECLHEKKGDFSADVKASLDVLIYVNMRKITINEEDYLFALPDESKLRQWRSAVLVLYWNRVLVACASDKAPAFIQAVVGKVIKK